VEEQVFVEQATGFVDVHQAGLLFRCQCIEQILRRLEVFVEHSDLAIAGNGFFRVKNPQTGQNFVTRAGNFRVDADGRHALVASAALPK